MSKGKKARLVSEDVIAGRAHPDVRDLIDLIHDVNPSGHEHLSAREIAGRYAVKSRLQSVLVRRFADDLVVEPVRGEPHLVTLRHRPSGVDACHALVRELDEDARSWVQRAIDLGDDADLSPPPRRAEPGRVAAIPAAPRSAPQLLGAARDALEVYDYEVARERLEAALAQGSERAAAQLLELLVDTLGADDDALALVPRLPDAARSRPDVCTLLALATARKGDRAAAIAHLRGVPPSEREASVFAALARHAIDAGDAHGATADLARVRERSPAHPALMPLAAAIEALRAPLEEAARRSLAEGRIAEAYARADELLARFPESPVGQRIARRRDEEHRLEQAARLAREAEQAIVAGALGSARFLVQKAHAEGLATAHAAGVRAQLAALEAEANERAEAARIADVARLLSPGQGESDATPALLAYLALRASSRAAVRARVNLVVLDWLDETGVTEGSGARARAAVLAVQALARAEAEVARDPRAALDLFAPHLKALASVSRAEALAQSAERALAEQREQRAREGLEASERAFAEGGDEGFARAKGLLAQVRPRDLDDDTRARLTALERQIEGTLERQRRRRRVDELRANDDPCGALRLLDGLLDATPEPAERAEYLEAHVALRAAIHEQYAIKSEILAAGTRRRLPGPTLDDPSRSLLPGGREIVVAQSCGRWIFLWILDVASGEMRERVRMHAEEPVRLQRIVIEAGRLSLVGTTGTVIELELSTWLPVLDSSSARSPDFSSDTAIAAGGRYTWVAWGSAGSFSLDVWDGKREEWCRQSRDKCRQLSIAPLHGFSRGAGADAPAMAVMRTLQTMELTLYSAHGTQLSTPRQIWLVPNAVVVHPCGETILAVAVSRSLDRTVARYELVEIDPRGSVLPVGDAREAAARRLDDFDEISPVHTAVDAPAGLVFLRFSTATESVLLCVETSAAGAAPPRDGRARPVKVRYRVAVPARTQLVEDPARQSVFAIVRDEADVEIIRLTASPPSLRAEPSRRRAPGPHHLSLVCGADCDFPTGARHQRVETLAATYYPQRATVIEAGIARAVKEGPGPTLDLMYALKRGQHISMWLRATEAAMAAFPDHPEVRLVSARHQTRTSRWDLTRERLEGVDVTRLSAPHVRHFHHLEGTALLWTGEPAKALGVLREAELHAGTCDLALALALATPLDDPDAGARAWTPAQLVARELMRCVAVADARLADGDPLGAIREMDTLLIHDLREVQSLARLAEAYLAVPDDGEGIDPFEKAFALATFSGAHADKTIFSRQELPLWPRWDVARLDALEARAVAWLTPAATE